MTDQTSNIRDIFGLAFFEPHFFERHRGALEERDTGASSPAGGAGQDIAIRSEGADRSDS